VRTATGRSNPGSDREQLLSCHRAFFLGTVHPFASMLLHRRIGKMERTKVRCDLLTYCCRGVSLRKGDSALGAGGDNIPP